MCNVDELDIHEVAHPHRLACGERVGPCRDEHELIRIQGSQLDIGMAHGMGDPDFDIPAQDHVDDLLLGPRPDPDRTVRNRAVACQRLLDPRHPNRLSDADDKRRSGPRVRERDRINAFAGRAHDPLGVGEKCLAGLGQAEPATRASCEERRAEIHFQAPKTLCQRRLRDEERLSRAREAACANDRQERLDVEEKHRWMLASGAWQG